MLQILRSSEGALGISEVTKGISQPLTVLKMFEGARCLSYPRTAPGDASRALGICEPLCAGARHNHSFLETGI